MAVFQTIGEGVIGIACLLDSGTYDDRTWGGQHSWDAWSECLTA
jgi:hypothetical protein